MEEKKREIFSGRIVSLAVEAHRLPDGRLADFEIVRHPGGAAVLPVLADGRVVLINQFRPAAGDMVLEIPAGRLEPGEAPDACVHRELQEEVGYCAGRLEKLGEMLTAVGFCDEVVHLYVATELLPGHGSYENDDQQQNRQSCGRHDDVAFLHSSRVASVPVRIACGARLRISARAMA